MSISSHVAGLASPERAAVRAKNLKLNLADNEAWDAETVSRAIPMSPHFAWEHKGIMDIGEDRQSGPKEGC